MEVPYATPQVEGVSQPRKTWLAMSTNANLLTKVRDAFRAPSFAMAVA